MELQDNEYKPADFVVKDYLHGIGGVADGRGSGLYCVKYLVPEFFIKLLTKPGQTVFDPFAGTGATAVAAERLKRRWLCAEINAHYAAVVPERLKSGR